MAPLTQAQLNQVRELFAEEFNEAFNQLIPGVTAAIIDQVRGLLDERLAAAPVGAPPVQPERDQAYYLEKFSKCRPPQWDGESDPVAAKHWMTDVESSLLICGCPDQYRVMVAMSLFRKKANVWWKGVTAQVTEDGVRAMTWAQFRERFEAQYVPRVEQQRMMQQFMALEQTTESVHDLNSKFLELLSFCPNFAGDEAWLVSRYTAVLRTDIREFVSMQEHPTLTAIMDAARRREIELQTQQLKRKTDSSSSKAHDAQKKQKTGGKTRFEYRPSTALSEKTCYNCKKTGHTFRYCPEPVRSAVPQITSSAPVCFHCREPGHRKPDCPRLKTGNSGGVTKPAIASSSKGPTVMTRGRAHQLTA